MVSDEIVRLGHVSTNPYQHVSNKEYAAYPKDDNWAKLGIDTSQYIQPARGPIAELESLISQNAGVRHVEEPPIEVLDMIVEIVDNKYPRSIDPFDKLHSMSYWTNFILPHVVADSSPGWPTAQISAKNGDILSNPALATLVTTLAISRIERLSKIEPDVLEHHLQDDPLWALDNDLADVHRIFVKKEPHPMRKLEKRSWRLINVLSLVDNLVDRFLFTEQDSVELATWNSIPSKCGSGLTDADARLLAEYAKDNRLNLETDVSGWDIKVPYFLLKLDIEARRKLNHGSIYWYNAARNVTTLAAHKIVMSSDGSLYRRLVPGGQSSGRKVTSSSNSRMRFMLHVLVSDHFGFCTVGAMTQGDDCVEHLPENISPEEYKKFMGTLGITIKLAERCSHADFGFCSQRFTEEGKHVIPENVGKMICNYTFETDEQCIEEAYASLRTNTRHCANHKIIDYAREILDKRLSAASRKLNE